MTGPCLSTIYYSRHITSHCLWYCFYLFSLFSFN